MEDKIKHMLLSLEVIKMDIKSDSHSGSIAQGKNELSERRYLTWKYTKIVVNICVWTFILYKIFA
jgi:hypothetical protein